MDKEGFWFYIQVHFLDTLRYEAKAVCFLIIVVLMTSRFSWATIWLVLLFTFRNLFWDIKSIFLLHSNSQNVSLVSFDSFDVLTALTAFALFNQSNHLAILKRIIVIGQLSVFYKSVEHAEEAARALLSCFPLHFFHALY